MFHRPLAVLVALIVLAVFPSPRLHAADPAAGRQVEQSLPKAGDASDALGYLLYLPKAYDAEDARRWPVLLFLHGSGERGSDLERVKVHGPPKLVEQGKHLPFIVVSPQCPAGRRWDVDQLARLVGHVLAEHRADPDRVYVTGLSMGGFGTWALACKHPEKFAAAVPICGRGDPEAAAAMKDVPTWAFHGDKDRAVPVEGTKEMVEALVAAGGDVKMTIYSGVGHDSWTRTYDNPELYKWLLAQRRKGS